MSRYRFRDDESSSTSTVLGVLAGAIAGFAVGVVVAQKLGGIEGITDRFRRRRARGGQTAEPVERAAEEFEALDDYEEDEIEEEGADEDLEMHVLEAFRNDPILAERAVDIGSIGDGIIELAGWVDTEEEAERAVTIARGVPDVETVVNRLTVGREEEHFDDVARRFAEGDASLNEAQWEGNTVGTGKRRQGTSEEPDRHADPRVDLEERWSSADEALRQAADDTDGSAERRNTGRKGASRGDRTGGSPIAPTGVPKADHVANPVEVVKGDRV